MRSKLRSRNAAICTGAVIASWASFLLLPSRKLRDFRPISVGGQAPHRERRRLSSLCHGTVPKISATALKCLPFLLTLENETLCPTIAQLSQRAFAFVRNASVGALTLGRKTASLEFHLGSES